MNSLFVLLGIESWKPIVTALLLPPVPFLLIILIGARLILPRRGLGWAIVVLSVAGLWLTSTIGFSRVVEQAGLHVPAAMSADRIKELKAEAKGKSEYAIVILGGGAEAFAPEYGVSNLGAYSMERLRYGLWLSRETGIPAGFSGGMGHAATQGAPEAEVASRIASQDFNRPLKWTEDQSHDTRENAQFTIPLMKKAGITHVLLVTNGYHMPRARRAFDDAAQGSGIVVEAAPMGLAARIEGPSLDWLPTGYGYLRSRSAIRELLGRLVGAY